MPENDYSIFTKEMKKTHTILVPMMLEPHFSIVCDVIRQEGYQIELLKTNHSTIADTGLKYTHNDICYPAILVIGQLIDALKSGKYDTHKTALLITQTGGGCRASNYIHLLRKALVQSGFGYVPVLSLNAQSLEKKNGFHLSLKTLLKAMMALLYGDFLLCIYNQSRTYEMVKGESKKALDRCVAYIEESFLTGKYLQRKKNYLYMLSEFNQIHRSKVSKPRVGIVGEIYMKYAPLGNNGLEDFLIEEGAEPVVSGILDFLLYCLSNGETDRKLYHIKKITNYPSKLLVKYLIYHQKTMISVVKENSDFIPPEDFSELFEAPNGIIGKGVKMGEGWLLTAEMISHVKNGVTNVVCTQPFGCLPNHIVAKGVMGKVREQYPKANIVAIDYDPGMCRVNQENRLKLMLMNAMPNEKQKGNQEYKTIEAAIEQQSQKETYSCNR
ncbi:2-hydroxyacyl-CoA dehydratase [Paludicola sp. MB14-C6]|uniref:2-hydroxyacyl-CoA dehydratase n=1 Tax=Paludihabitans sp. MB14-C6 TaxID=3070656 RepID=UPI0027DAF446|nr:2-hydroxyacyl-CoA dehydratase [Paludicola sp. MB14-C6]WMJ23089.1 2-hydroxyacyl-CoA dehydratase [Paludicola sp. MB14-C6]